MAEVTLTSKDAVLATANPPDSARLPSLDAGEDLLAGAPCYIKNDGKVYMSTAAAADAAAQVHGWTVQSVLTGNPVTLYREVNIGYGVALTPGSAVYLSATVAGGLQTVAQANQTAPIGLVVSADGKRIRTRVTV